MISSVIKTLKQPVGCAEVGGIYGYKFSGFWKVLVLILPSIISMCKSKKFVAVVGSF
jgi:hypothetical protein